VLSLSLAALLMSSITNSNAAVAAGNNWTRGSSAKAQSSGEKTEQKEVRFLEQGQAIERELKEGESHTFRIALKTGQYFKVSVEQQGVVVEARALDPAGKPIARNLWAELGTPTSLWVVAEVPGAFGVIITALDKWAVGQYTIRLDKVADLQTASSADQSFVKGSRLYWEGMELSGRGTDQALQQAAEKFRQSGLVWRSLKLTSAEAFALHELAYTVTQAGDGPKALELYDQALALWRAVTHGQRWEANTLYNMGGIYTALGKAQKAIDSYKQAIELRRTIGDQSGQAYALNNLGQTYINLGDFQAALEAHQEALRLRRLTSDVEGQARSLSNISGVYFSLSEFQEALNYCMEALPLRRAAEDRRGVAITLSNIGSNYRELGEPAKALEYSQQALALVRETGDRGYESAILDVVGRNYYDLGDYPKALEFHGQSLALRQVTKDRFGEGSTLANIGNAYARMGERRKALEYFEQALQLRHSIGDRRGEALTLQSAGVLYKELGDPEKAMTYLSQALAISKAIKNRVHEANLLYEIASLEELAGHQSEALTKVEAAIAIIESARAKVASADLRASFLASKQDYYALDIDLLMQSFLRDRDQESLAKAFVVSEQRRARSFLDTLEESRADIRQGVSPDLLLRERAQRAKLNQKAESQIKLLSGKHTPEQAAALDSEVDAIANDYDQVRGEIRTFNQRYAALTQPTPVSLREIQTAILDPNTVLLEYSLGKERSYLWAITSNDIAGYELPARSEIESRARSVYDLLTCRNRFVKFEKPSEKQLRIARAERSYNEIAGALSQMLLGPIATQINGKRLLIVGEGALQYLPFAALPAPVPETSVAKWHIPQGGSHPLVLDHELISLPSASVLGVLRRELSGRQPAPKALAVLADPVFDKTDQRVSSRQAFATPVSWKARSTSVVADSAVSDGELVRSVSDPGSEDGFEMHRLPYTRSEAEAILSLTPETDQFKAFDFEANRATAVNPQLGQYRIVHFATHGLLNTVHPALSGLVFSLVDKDGRDQRGFLAAHEIFNLKLPAELVVLSGCRTGLGKEVKGEGILGLMRGFMYAGAVRVLVSLWDVNDKSTAELMTQFYGRMLGKNHLSPAAALRGAQIAMWKSAPRQSPYFWAAFVLQGEYR